MKNLTNQKGSYYFEMLTTEEQAKFRANILSQESFSMEEILKSNFGSFMRFVGSCFSFDEAPEGAEYWRDIARECRDGVDADNYIGDMIKELVISMLSEDIISDFVDPQRKYSATELLEKMDSQHVIEWKKEFNAQRSEESDVFLKIKYKSVSHMIMSSFRFSDTELGGDYWSGICDEYAAKDATESLINDLGLTKEDESN